MSPLHSKSRAFLRFLYRPVAVKVLLDERRSRHRENKANTTEPSSSLAHGGARADAALGGMATAGAISLCVMLQSRY
jgi:hypothetical protein